MIVVYDHREEKSGVPGRLALAGIELESAQLPVGDYLISDRVAIERKSPEDFTASIKDGRLFEQAERLKASYSSAIMIVEGKPYMGKNVVEGAISSLLRHGLSVLRVEDQAESVEWIVRLARQEGRGNSRPRPAGARKAGLTSIEAAQRSLIALPGISQTKAERLLEHFGSLQAVISADPKQLQEVEGIGKLTAHKLHEIFTVAPGSTPFD